MHTIAVIDAPEANLVSSWQRGVCSGFYRTPPNSKYRFPLILLPYEVGRCPQENDAEPDSSAPGLSGNGIRHQSNGGYNKEKWGPGISWNAIRQVSLKNPSAIDEDASGR